MYDAAVIGKSIHSPSLSLLQINNPESLVSVGGEIGDFRLRYRNSDESISESFTRTVIINVDAEEELPEVPETLSFCDDITENEKILNHNTLLFVQDYEILSPAIMSKKGLEKVVKLMENSGELDIYYFYRSMRFIDNNDRLFERARKQGVVFLPYEQGNLQFTGEDLEYTREDFTLNFTEPVIMAPRLKPSPHLKRLARLFNIESSPEGYLQTENIYLQPTKSGKRGIYVVGGARGPTGYSSLREDVEYTLNEIKSMQDIKPLVDDERTIDAQKCVLCYNCYRICPHGALERDEEEDAMKVNNLACQGCNACISRCPAGAISLVDEEEEDVEEELMVLMCENSAEIAFNKYKKEYRKNSDLHLETIPCTGSLKKDNLLKRLRGKDNRLLILGCFEDSCKHLNGEKRGEQVVTEVKEILKKLNLGDSRLQFKRLSPRMAEDLGTYLSGWKEGKL